MRERTMFYRQELLARDTGQVQSLRSYIQTLALSHSMKPLALLTVLAEREPLENLSTDHGELTKRWAIHGFSEFGGQVRQRLERASDIDLKPATLAKFEGLFSNMNLTRKGEAMYCPCCVAEGEDLPYGRLLWEVQCVTACPIHKVRLRSGKVCGSEKSSWLPLQSRPSMSGVCTACGSVGFRCITEVAETALAEEVWVAQQVERLIAMPEGDVAKCSGATLLAGLKKLVEGCYGNSSTRASVDAGLSRASVHHWLSGKAVPGLPGILQICAHARADVTQLIAGKNVMVDCAAGLPERNAITVMPRSYVRAKVADAELPGLLTEAAKEAEPPSLAKFSERHGIDVKCAGRRGREHAKALIAISAAHAGKRNRRRFERAVSVYQLAAAKLEADGSLVHEKALQQVSGLPAYSGGARHRALRLVLGGHRPGAASQGHRVQANGPTCASASDRFIR